MRLRIFLLRYYPSKKMSGEVSVNAIILCLKRNRGIVGKSERYGSPKLWIGCHNERLGETLRALYALGVVESSMVKVQRNCVITFRAERLTPRQWARISVITGV